jgi:F-type H+-transporting ATPase subunit a
MIALFAPVLAADSARVAVSVAGEHATAAHGEGNTFTQLLHHLRDSHELDLFPFGQVHLPSFPPVHILGLEVDLSITKHVVFLWVAAILLCVVAISAVRRNRRSEVPSGFGNLMEVFVQFMRDEIVIPNMGSGGMRYMPYLMTTFFFILIMNLVGLVPYGATATGNVNVTAGLAIVAFIMIQVSAIRSQGIGHYFAHLTGGVHWALWVIMIPIEIIGLFTKPFALCIRLFANMTAGHVVIASLFGLIFMYKSFVLAPGPVVFAVGINMLEIFIAFLQAYVFTMLTALFMGLGMLAEHEPHEEHSHSHPD